MKELVQDLLNDLNTMSMDDMDNFEKYDYFVDNVKHKIYDLCKKVVDDSPKVLIEVDNNKDLQRIEEQIIYEYEHCEAAMWDLLASIGVNNISLEQATELYASLMKYSDNDVMVRFTSDIHEEDLDQVGDYIIL